METGTDRTGNRLSLVQLLVTTAVVACLSSILFPTFSAFAKSKVTNKHNLQLISRGAIVYGEDYDGMIPLLSNGAWRNLRNVRDGDLTQYNEQRTDLWPLILLPYVKDRTVYRDPRREDLAKVWKGPALASADSGYNAVGSTYRNQNRTPMFGVNYIFLSPMVIPASKLGDTTPGDFGVGEARSFSQAKNPGQTVFYVPSFGNWGQEYRRFTGGEVGSTGFFAPNAPGMGGLENTRKDLVIFTTETLEEACGTDWCGDVLPGVPGKQPITNATYIEPTSEGNNLVFLDGHVRFMKHTQMAAGTNYVNAVPNGPMKRQGAVITDKSKYLWNLDDNYYGLY